MIRYKSSVEVILQKTEIRNTENLADGRIWINVWCGILFI